MSEMNRRELLGLLALTPISTALKWNPASVARARALAGEAHQVTATRGAPYELKFFTAHEYQTVGVLADLIIPRDERSGSATDAGAPEFMDFILSDHPNNQVPVRGGLAWLDNECRHRFSQAFIGCTPAQQTALLDDLAWPAKAKPEVSQGVEFLSRFRDMTASAFFSSRMGVEDLQYKGNTFVTEWTGCPPDALAKLGVKYD